MKPAPHPLNSAAWRHVRIGLLGGSFNPAHAGHLHISLFALKAMKLDYVWWLVSPQNPLKPECGMASFEERLRDAKALAQAYPRIIVSDLESQLATRFTTDTLRKLHARFPATHFIWMMGADNLLQIPHWERWPEIFKRTSVAVFRRPPYFVGAFHSKAALRFAKNRISPRKARLLGRGKPKWILFNNRLSAISATQLRQGRI